MSLACVQAIWEDVCRHRLSKDRARAFAVRPEADALAAFSEPALREAAQRVLQRDSRLLLCSWLEQIAADVYDRRGVRSAQPSPEFLEAKAMSMRLDPTPSERALWALMKKGVEGVVFKRQAVVLGEFIVDFYAPSIQLAVEVDGSSHRLSGGADGRRDELLLAEGMVTVRLRASGVMRSPKDAVATIARRMQEPDLRPRVARAGPVPVRREQPVRRKAEPQERPVASSRPAIRVVYSPAAPKRPFKCARCERRFVAPASPAPPCLRHPDAAVIRLCANGDGRLPVSSTDLCKVCLDARSVARSAGSSVDPFGQRHHTVRKAI